ncbi:igLON family member 5 [Polypterus senegalus]|uniref:igLON family member 5 n=1 Tax=Polypterus senegalus TaxID=55291 RepID=UPI001962E45E|nr:igLON family member 5 [Polypterus senegalus]
MSYSALRNVLWGFVIAVFTKGLCVSSSDFIPPTENMTVTQGDSAVLRCFIDSEVVHKAWLNRSNILFTGNDKWSLDPRVTVISNNKSEFSIKINNVSVIDEGTYTCSYQSRNEPRTAHVYLIVQVPAKIVNISSDISVNEGSNVNLFCLAIGRPEPTIKWKHKDGEMSEGEFLEITGITRYQADEYECVTENGPSNIDVRKVQVTVNYPPVITDGKNMPAQVGKTALLRCEAMSVPAASFEWYKDDKRLAEHTSGIRIQNEKTRSLLMFNNVTSQHFGNYTCFASNKLGSYNYSMLLFRPGALKDGATFSVSSTLMMPLWTAIFILLLKI